jgi:hypothetical protein
MCWISRPFASVIAWNIVEPISGAEIESFLQQVPKDPKVKAFVQQVLGAGPLPAAR